MGSGHSRGPMCHMDAAVLNQCSAVLCSTFGSKAIYYSSISRPWAQATLRLVWSAHMNDLCTLATSPSWYSQCWHHGAVSSAHTELTVLATSFLPAYCRVCQVYLLNKKSQTYPEHADKHKGQHSPKRLLSLHCVCVLHSSAVWVDSFSLSLAYTPISFLELEFVAKSK